MARGATSSLLPTPRAFRLGITGKIGSGKSTLCKIARLKGILVLEADQIAKQIMVTDSEIMRKIRSLIGENSYEGTSLNKSFVASKIFSDEVLRKQLELIVHPATLDVYEKEFRACSSGQIIALESAILFQTELDDLFDAMILVDAREEQIIERYKYQGRISKEEMISRMIEQHYKNEWKEDSDFVISNNGSEEEFVQRCESMIELIKIVAVQNLPQEPMRMIVE